MGVAIVPLGSPARLTCAIAVGCVLSTCEAVAFPATDAGTPSVVESAPPPTESDLRHQLQLQSGFGATAGGNPWIIVPSLGADEFFTDNVLQTPTNRRWDLVTVVTPGITINGDLPNAQVNFNYSPQFRLDARTPSQNGVIQQLSGTGLFTIVEDEFYVDTRVLAGGTPLTSGFGGLGATLTPNLGLGGVTGAATTGLSKQNIAQTFSASITPYWLHRFGDFGTAKVGYELNASSISQSGGGTLLPTFFPTGGVNQHTVTNQGVAQFETGEEFAPFRYMVVASGAASNGTGVLHGSDEESIKNRLGYQITRTIGVYGQIGYERERFGGVPPTRVDDAIWGFGATWTPNADSQITLGYGHENGVSGVQLSAYYALTARTRITASYVTGLQTDLGQLQNQLDLTAFDQNGAAVDALTGAPLFSGLSGIGVQNGLFRAKNFNMSAITVLDRDSITLTVQYSEQTTIAVDNNFVAFNPFTPLAPPVGSTNQGVTGYALWQHSLSDDLLMSSGASYGVTNVSGGPSGAPGTGRQTSIGATVGLQYTLTPTLTTAVRYSYFRRGSPVPDQTIYQNVVLVGINKQF